MAPGSTSVVIESVIPSPESRMSWYPVTGQPPSSAGASQPRVIVVASPVILSRRGGGSGPTHACATRASLSSDSPFWFMALTLNW